MPTARNRFWSAPPATHNTNMVHGWSETATITGSANTITGAWTPLAVNPDGTLSVQVSGLAFSGSLEINTDVLENINTSGVQFNAAVSGLMTRNTRSDAPSGYAPYTGIVSVNRAVVTSGYNPQFASGAAAVTAIDNVNGGTLAVMSDLDASIDSITTYPATATTTSNYLPSGNIGTTMVTGNILMANPNRIAWGIQNIGSGSSLYLKLGSAPASATSFNWLIKAASSDFGSDGGTFLDTPAFYRGDISISGSSRFTIWEM